MLLNGQEIPMNDQLRAEFNDAYLTLGGMGERVLGFCQLFLPLDKYPKGYSFNTDEVRYFSVIIMN
jgi:sodium/potassium-transporting ATPase subunit alpha